MSLGDDVGEYMVNFLPCKDVDRQDTILHFYHLFRQRNSPFLTFRYHVVREVVDIIAMYILNPGFSHQFHYMPQILPG